MSWKGKEKHNTQGSNSFSLLDTGFSETTQDQVKHVNNPLDLRAVASCPAVEMLGRGREDQGLVSRRNPLSHPGGLEDTGFQSCSHQFWVCCSLCLVSFLPWGPPPKGSASVLSAEGVPRGPPSGWGWGDDATATLLGPGSLPRAVLSPRPQALPEPRQKGCLPAPSFSPPHPPGSLNHRELDSLTVAGSRYPGSGGLGGLRGPRPLSFLLPMEMLAGGTAFPSCPALEAGAGHSGSCSPHTTQVTPVQR